MARTAVEIVGMHAGRDGMLHVALSLRTEEPAGIPAISTTGTPIRLSGKYVDADAAMSDDAVQRRGWDGMRQDLTVDVTPGAAQPVDLIMSPPESPGRYRIAVSLVQDGVAWFHDRGMPIALSRLTVTLDGAMKIGD